MARASLEDMGEDLVRDDTAQVGKSFLSGMMVFEIYPTGSGFKYPQTLTPPPAPNHEAHL